MTTTTEFREWLIVIAQEEWQERSKTDYYLAQIAAEIRTFREGFSKSPKSISVKDYLLDFGQSGEKREDRPEKAGLASVSTQGGIEMGPAALEDLKWAKVTANAKAVWATRLGIKLPGSSP